VSGKGGEEADGHEVRAAGGVLLREGPAGRRVLLVHRPRYDDWSLPKGKLDKGESFEQAAVREIEEETGLRCALGDELEPASYTDHKGRSKLVRWYLMEPVDPADLEAPFEPNDEVDEIRWLDAAEALELARYEHDRRLIGELALETPEASGTEPSPDDSGGASS
jgi:8-oxo-dGTP diphosphatase